MKKKLNKQRTLNLLIPTAFKIKNGNLDIARSWFFDTLSKHYNLTIYCRLIGTDEFHVKHGECSYRLISFFDDVRPMSVMQHFLMYKRKIKHTFRREDLVFIMYPFHITSLFLGLLLRKHRLVVWVKSELKDMFMLYGSRAIKPLLFLLKPFFCLFYDTLSRFIFRGNLIFYTSAITIDKKNHRNQIEVVSNSYYNRKKSLIRSKRSNKIYFVGNGQKQKGLSVLLKALKGSDKELNIIGMDNVVDKRLRSLMEGINVRFHGKITNRDAFYEELAKADILVMPSFGEKQGKVQLEAMSVGVVPVCSDSGGTYRTVSNYYNGLLFKQGDHRDLRRKIDALYTDKGLYDALQGNGLDYVKTLSIDAQIKKMAEIINNYYP
jgi:glycosyltransferase involved in cell wall biosynthesis